MMLTAGAVTPPHSGLQAPLVVMKARLKNFVLSADALADKSYSGYSDRSAYGANLPNAPDGGGAEVCDVDGLGGAGLEGVGEAGIDGLALGDAGADGLPLLAVEPPTHAAPLIVQPLGCRVPE